MINVKLIIHPLMLLLIYAQLILSLEPNHEVYSYCISIYNIKVFYRNTIEPFGKI